TRGSGGAGSRRDDNFSRLIEVACAHGKPVRIGVNWGSLDQRVLARMMDENARRAGPWDAAAVMREALVVSAIESAEQAVSLGLSPDAIVLSAKVSSDRKSTRLNSSHVKISYAVFCLKKKKHKQTDTE